MAGFSLDGFGSGKGVFSPTDVSAELLSVLVLLVGLSMVSGSASDLGVSDSMPSPGSMGVGDNLSDGMKEKLREKLKDEMKGEKLNSSNLKKLAETMRELNLTSEMNGSMSGDGSWSTRGSSGPGGATSGLSAESNGIGGPASLSNQVALVVDAPENRYLKLASYDEYSGDRWDRNFEMEEYSEPVVESDGEVFEQTIYINRSLRNLVGTPKVQRIEGVGTGVEINDGGLMKADEALGKGDNYTVVSRIPDYSVSDLRSSGEDYPEKIEEKYTKLPDQVPDRVYEKSSEIMEGEENAYDKVKAVEEWLAENKEYSLDAPDNPRDMGIAEHFIFNTDVGYCSYFASAAVVMLRSQDIPTRYVSGYSPGKENSEGDYVVRSKNAHAWIEVYFPEEGWIKFDPTAGSSQEYEEAHESDDRDQEQPSRDDLKSEEEKEREEERKEERREKEKKERQKNGAASGLSMDQKSNGGSMSLSNDVALIMDAPRNTYLKQASYDEYSTSGWSRNYRMSEYSEPVVESDGETYRQYIYLNRSLKNLVATPRVQRIEGVESELSVDSGERIRTDEILESGETYTVVSKIPDYTISGLKESGTDYPEGLEEKYTKLPNEVPERVYEKSSEITEGKENAFAKVNAIKQWLAKNKKYSLDATSTPPDTGLAEHFIFNTNKGYCSYFASAAAVMLRTQDIPTRYVSGYGGGSRNSEGDFVVREKHAHAWIEVYFPEEGWITFDPTSGSSEAYEEARVPEEEQPSKDEVSDEEIEKKEERENDEKEEEKKDDSKEEDKENRSSPEPEYNLEVNNTDPVPGQRVSGEVTKSKGGNSSGVENAEITVNGFVYETGSDGSVAFDVPYSRYLNLSYQKEGLEESFELPQSIDLKVDGRLPGNKSLVEADIEDVPVDDGKVMIDENLSTRTEEGEANITLPWKSSVNISVSRGSTEGKKEIDVIDDLKVDVLNDTLPSSDVNFSVKIGNKSVKGAEAFLNSSSLGETSEDGSITIELPSNPGNYSYKFEKGEADGSINVTVENLTISAEPQTPVPLPMTTTKVKAELGDSPAEKVNVSFNGKTVQTGENGSFTANNPFSNSFRFNAEGYGQKDSTEVSNMLVNMGALVLLLVLPIGGLSFMAYRRSVSPLILLKGLGRDAVRVLIKVRERGFDILISGAIYISERARDSVKAAVTAVKNPVRTWERWRSSYGGLDTVRDAVSNSESHSMSIDEAWRTLKNKTTLDDLSHRTPGEIERYAVEVDRLPEEEVTEVVEAFRRVKYAEMDLDKSFGDSEMFGGVER